MGCVEVFGVVGDLVLGGVVVDLELDGHVCEVDQLLVTFDHIDCRVVQNSDWY